MSPSPRKPASHALTIEFAGVCTLIWNKKTGTAEVHLVDLGTIGFARHTAAVSIAVEENQPPPLTGADAEVSLSLAGSMSDVGLWNLLDCTVDFVGGLGKLTVDAATVDVTKEPARDATSIRWLANVGALTESTTLNPAGSTAAVINVPAGHITAASVGTLRKVQFVDGDDKPIGPARYCLPRFRVTMPFADRLAMRLDRRRVLTFTRAATIVVSNTCVCGLNSAPAIDFYAHYDVVAAKRRPRIQLAGPLPRMPLWPEYCIDAFVEQ